MPGSVRAEIDEIVACITRLTDRKEMISGADWAIVHEAVESLKSLIPAGDRSDGDAVIEEATPHRSG